MSQNSKIRDREILELFRTSPDLAFRSLFDTYYMQLCVYVVQISDSFDMAEDIVQDFFLYFWEKKYYRGVTDDLRSYLFSSVRHKAIAEMKRRGMSSTEDLTGIPCHAPEDCSDLEQLREREKRLAAELDKLPPGEIAAVRKVILENKKYRDAAAELNISINTLKTQLSRALRKLRKGNNLMSLLY